MGADGARKRKIAVIAALAAAVLLLALLELLVGSSGMSVRQCVSALFGSGDSAAVRIMQHIRLPRLLAAVIAGAGLSVSGLIMQTVLGNPMASPATLGVSNAAVFGANLSIIALSGGFLSTGNNLTSYTAGADPFATSALAFVFAAGSVLVVLALCRLRDFSPNVVVLAGIALGSVWTAATTILQFYATDVGLSAAVIWSFGDLGRATYRADWIMLAVTAAGLAVFAALAWRYNALLSGGDAAGSMGVNAAAVGIPAAGIAHHGGVRVVPGDDRLCGYHLSPRGQATGGPRPPVGAAGGGPVRRRAAAGGGRGEPQYRQRLRPAGGGHHLPVGRAVFPDADLWKKGGRCMLKVEHVTFRYERRGAPVLRDASLSLETGQVGVLLGRNGCGKTTLLKTTLGLCTPEQGQILFDGQALGAMKRQQRAQVAAYVPQELQFGALRVYDAVLAGRVSRFGIQPGAADRTAAEAALADMDLTALAERNVQTLSGGERQKVAIARALAQEPKLLVFDEPTGNLDVANEQRILRQARRLARTRGMTVLCTLHDLNQAMAYGDRLFLMRDGQVRYAGNGDILTPETVWDIFGARVRAAEIDGQKILIGVNEDEY